MPEQLDKKTYIGIVRFTLRSMVGLAAENKGYNLLADTLHYYETTINVLSPSKIDDASKVRVALYKDGYLTPSTLSTLKTGEITANFTNPLSNSIANYVVDEGYLPAKTTKTFNLAMWIGYDVTEFNDDFKTQILVTGIAKESETLTDLSGGVNILKNNTIINDTDYTKTTQDGLYYLKRNDEVHSISEVQI